MNSLYTSNLHSVSVEDITSLPGVAFYQEDGYWGAKVDETGQEFSPIYDHPGEIVEELFPVTMSSYFYEYLTWVDDPLCGRCAMDRYLAGEGVLEGNLLDYDQTDDKVCIDCGEELAQKNSCEYHGSRYAYWDQEDKFRCLECDPPHSEYEIVVIIDGKHDSSEDLEPGIDDEQAIAAFHDIVEDTREQYAGHEWEVYLERYDEDSWTENLAKETSNYREIASHWHGGGGSALYEFASTGSFSSIDRLLQASVEVEDNKSAAGSHLDLRELELLQKHLGVIAESY